MLKRIVPYGTVLRNVYTELHDGAITFGRQIGSYPLLVGIPYKLELERFYDVIVTGWGFRSITALEYPFPINTANMAAISSLPGIGKKRAATIVRYRPYNDMESLSSVLDDPQVSENLRPFLRF
jgi:radical SAM superfamily enzyme with C-terminal helix-hairpin-helix motif